ncbi:MAG: trehalose-phosphatase [Rhizobiales bacterium]|nr:trehalose-phosphatase [Hyphomicrobiales bacterium]
MAGPAMNMTDALDLPLPASEVALFLDIDGTLIEHRPHPTDAKADRELLDLLATASAKLSGALALVTGRSIEMVDAMFAPLSLPVAGLYGLEHRLRTGDEAELADEPADLAAIADALHREFHTVEGVYFERKGPVLAIHTRAAPAALPSVRRAAEAAIAQLTDRYRLVAGHAGIEFIPIEALKGAAIQRFLEIAPFAGRRPIFIGDDVSDENGFDYVNTHGGVSIRVKSSGETAARHCLESVGAVHRFIGALVT